MAFTHAYYFVCFVFLSNVCGIYSLFDDTQKTEILLSHNNYRANVVPLATDMEEMVWDDTLADVAQAYSDQCIYEHNGDRTTDAQSLGASYWYVGENLYMSAPSGGDYSTASVDAWYNEVSDYDYESNTCETGAVCGHYTQVVWSSSYAVGCGHTVCDYLEGMSGAMNSYCESYGCNIVVCNYGPGGNIGSSLPYATGATSCSECPADKPFCVDEGLCSAESGNEDTTTTNTGTTDTTTTDTTTSDTTTTETGSCNGICGGHDNWVCFCDSDCLWFGDCCSDACDECNVCDSTSWTTPSWTSTSWTSWTTPSWTSTSWASWSSNAPCDYTFGGSCYFTDSSPMNYASAQELCSSYGAHVVTIGSGLENFFVSSLVTPVDHVWLGFTDSENEDDWLWEDGSEVYYTNWASGEPNDAGGEDCAEMYVSSADWNDISCTDTNYVVCEYSGAEASVTYTDAVLALSPFLYLTMSQTAGTTLYDSVGFHHAELASGSISIQDLGGDELQEALFIDDTVFAIENSDQLASDPFTLLFWVKATAGILEYDFGYPIDFSDASNSSAGNFGYRVKWHSSTQKYKFCFGRPPSASWTCLQSPQINIGDWTFLAITYDPDDTSNFALYTNGDFTDSHSDSHGETQYAPNTQFPMGIGGQYPEDTSSNVNFVGAIDEVAMFDYVLDPVDLMSLYDLGNVFSGTPDLCISNEDCGAGLICVCEGSSSRKLSSRQLLFGSAIECYCM